MDQIEPYHFDPKFQDIRAGAWNTTKMAAKLVVLLDILADDDFENDFFEDEEDDLILFPASSTFAKRNLNRIQGFFEQTIPTYSLDEFKAHLHMQRPTSEIVTRENSSVARIPITVATKRNICHNHKRSASAEIHHSNLPSCISSWKCCRREPAIKLLTNGTEIFGNSS